MPLSTKDLNKAIRNMVAEMHIPLDVEPDPQDVYDAAAYLYATSILSAIAARATRDELAFAQLVVDVECCDGLNCEKLWATELLRLQIYREAARQGPNVCELCKQRKPEYA